MTHSSISQGGGRDAKTLTIGVVAYDGVETLDLTGPLDVFAMANGSLYGTGIAKESVYPIKVLAKQAGLVTSSCGLQINADCAYEEFEGDLDTLLIPGSPNVNSLLCDPALLDWVSAMSSRVRRVVSICTGAFLLAETGLLDGRCATTHWAYCERLAADYPAVTVEPDRIFLRDGPILTSGGVTAGIDLALALVEEDWGREVALLTARMMVVFLQRPGGQSQFSGYLASEATNHTDLRDLLVWIMEHPAEDHRIEMLAERIAMSPRNFARVFLAETGMTPAKFVEKARIDAARHYLSNNDSPIERVALISGFGDAERMRRAFIRNLGINPQDFRARFGGHKSGPPMPIVTPTHVAALKTLINAFETPARRNQTAAQSLQSNAL